MQAPLRQLDTRREVDWESTSLLLLERLSEPAFVVRASGAIAIVNQGFLALLELPRDQVVDAQLDDVLCVTDGGSWPLELALRGAITRFECATRLRDDRRLLLIGELSIIGEGPDACVLATITHYQPECATGGGTRYEVSLAPLRGQLRRVWRADGSVTEHFDGGLCYQRLLGADAPCRGCPVFEAGVASDAVSVVGSRGGPTRLVNTHAARAGTIEVTAIEAPDDLVSRLVRARTERLCQEAELTERERAVLEYILLARATGDIAAELGISARTVKYHQANLLAKLGAESRLDLLRLLL